MAQRNQLLNQLKQVLKERSLTYADVAKKLGLSVASIKRLFSSGDLSLQRVDEICELAGLEISELVERMQAQGSEVVKLTVAQEQEIVADPKLFLVTWLVLNRVQFESISRRYKLTEREVQRYLIKLDRLKVLELQPLNRIKLLVSRHFSWRPGGPVQKYIHQKLLKEFLSTHFLDEREEFFFHGAEISDEALPKLKRALQNASRECVDIMDRDQSLKSPRAGAAFVLAMRPWRYSGFAEFQRDE